MYSLVITSFKLNSCAYIIESKPNNDETYDAVFAYEIFYGAAESDFFVPTGRKRKPVIGKNYPLFRKTVLEDPLIFPDLQLLSVVRDIGDG